MALPAFAKINLGLRLLGRRSDGYWEIRTVYQTVSLHDRLRLRLAGRRGEVRLRVLGGGAPSGRRNLVHRMLARAAARLGVRRGVEIDLEKSIPAGRGLGGGSSDAAAALLGLLRLVRVRLSQEELARLGAQVGADVPFFFLGGRALGVGRGDEVYSLPEAGPASCLLLCPDFPVSTRAAYGWAAHRGRAARLTPPGGRAIITSSGLPPGELWDTGNDFEPVVFSRFPALARMKEGLLRAGAHQAALSGSGSTLYALFSQPTAARRAAARWAGAAAAFVVETVPRARYRQTLGWGVVQW